VQQSSGAKKGLKVKERVVSEKCLGTGVPVDCKSVRIRLMVSQGCDEINLLHSEGPWVYKAHPGDQNGNPSWLQGRGHTGTAHYRKSSDSRLGFGNSSG
jgi:hypothetical protein